MNEYDVVRLKSVGSTNEWAKGQDFVRPTFVVAESQTKGRGTFGKGWHSPSGCNLYVTFAYRGEVSRELATEFAFCVGRVVEGYGLKPEYKWPNDLLIGGKKVCGVLVDVSDDRIFVGIGLNVNASADDLAGIDQPVTSLAIELGHKVDREEVLERLIEESLQGLE